MKSEIENYADFKKIRYSQCWEDADILLEALKVKKDGTYVSIASAGDNSFAILSKSPRKVVALDLNEQQLFCVELRKEAYRRLSYGEFMILAGVKNGDRQSIYQKVREGLSKECRDFWDENRDYIKEGYFRVGKFEQYFHLFSQKVLPITFKSKKILSFFQKRTMEEQRKFYYKSWNTFRWKITMHFFFSERVMAKIGRDKAFFRYVKNDVAKHAYKRFEKGFLNVPMYSNPYMRYLMLGNFSDDALPYALRKENFDTIKENIDCLEIRKECLEEYLEGVEEHTVDGFNLSDIFEYMSEENMKKIYAAILKAARKDARVAYWNMLVDRNCPSDFREQVETKWKESERLTNEDKAFFYKRFLVEVVKYV